MEATMTGVRDVLGAMKEGIADAHGGFQAEQARNAGRREVLQAELNQRKAEMGVEPILRPKFTDAVRDGVCPNCGGSSFRAKRSPGNKGFGAIFGVVGILLMRKNHVACETCGQTWRRG
jgi:hypothetical protein